MHLITSSTTVPDQFVTTDSTAPEWGIHGVGPTEDAAVEDFWLACKDFEEVLAKESNLSPQLAHLLGYVRACLDGRP